MDTVSDLTDLCSCLLSLAHLAIEYKKGSSNSEQILLNLTKTAGDIPTVI